MIWSRLGNFRRMGDRMRDERLWAALVVLLLHVACSAWLLNFDPGRRVPVARRALPEEAIQVVYLARSAPPVASPAPVKNIAVRSRKDAGPEVVLASRAHRDAATAAIDGLLDTNPQPRLQLDLALPSRYTAIEIASRDALADRGVIERHTSRFEKSWKPQGNLWTQLAWESKIAGTILSAFGGPPRRCTEVEKRLRKPDCLPDDYEQQHEAWQRQRDRDRNGQ